MVLSALLKAIRDACEGDRSLLGTLKALSSTPISRWPLYGQLPFLASALPSRPSQQVSSLSVSSSSQQSLLPLSPLLHPETEPKPVIPWPESAKQFHVPSGGAISDYPIEHHRQPLPTLSFPISQGKYFLHIKEKKNPATPSLRGLVSVCMCAHTQVHEKTGLKGSDFQSLQNFPNS